MNFFQESILETEEELYRGNLDKATSILNNLEESYSANEEKLIINITKSRIVLGKRDYKEAERI